MVTIRTWENTVATFFGQGGKERGVMLSVNINPLKHGKENYCVIENVSYSNTNFFLLNKHVDCKAIFRRLAKNDNLIFHIILLKTLFLDHGYHQKQKLCPSNKKITYE